MQNTGIHHVSVLSQDIHEAYRFYHDVLGLMLTIKTVNQDDPTMYHLFFGDKTGREGTEFTVFELKNAHPNVFGTNAIERTMFLVPSRESLTYWMKRFDEFDVCHYGIEHLNGRDILRFEDSEGQKLGLVYRDNLTAPMNPYVAPDIEAEHAILGLGDVFLRVRYIEPTQRLLEERFGFNKVADTQWNTLHVVSYEFDNDFQHQIHLIEDKTSPIQRLGTGGIHHISFGVEQRLDLEELQDFLDDHHITNSTIINREFIYSTYFREPNYNLFEVATPITKESNTFPDQAMPFDDMPLYLPQFLEDKRDTIEQNLQQ